VTFDESPLAKAGNVGANDFELDVAGVPAAVGYHGLSACRSGLDSKSNANGRPAPEALPSVAGCYSN